MAYEGGTVKPGQFFEVSIPKYGEAPISVSGIGEGYIEFTIRKVGKVTNEIFEKYEGEKLFLRGPYGNGFDVLDYQGKEIVIIAGGTGVSPVRGVIEHFHKHPEQTKGVSVVAGFKSPSHILFLEDFAAWKRNMDIILTVDCAETDASCQIGLVTEYIPKIQVKNKQEAVAIVVGPPVMMDFTVKGLLREGFKEENIWISHERKMCCGIGKCGHCKMDDTYICLEGPVFNYTKGKLLVD
jgi:anaerobic sulfite reductase subunit B